MARTQSLNYHHEKKHHNQVVKHVPKGCLAVKIGGNGEEKHRFVIPIFYFNHPLFVELLKGAEEEYGFDHKGAITIPCNVDEFRYIRDVIEKERSSYHNQLHVVGCFRI